MAPPYQFETWLDAQNELALRLNDPNMVRWTKAEIQVYLAESLRFWNCLTQQWVLDWTTTYTQPGVPVWQSTGNNFNTLVGNNMTSPRRQTLTNDYLFKAAQYHLLEPPTGVSPWTGTTMFSLTDFMNGFASNRDEILQLTDCNVGPFSPTLSITPGTNRIQIPDTILDVRRIRFIPPNSAFGNPATLYRDDQLSFEYFTNDYEQSFDNPLCWDVLGSPQQFITFDTKPNIPNNLDCLGIVTADALTPPTASPLLIPDDFYWVLKFSMMADLLAKETESKDLLRSQYCDQRAQEGIQLMQKMPWLMQGFLNSVPVDTPDFYTLDQSDEGYEWQSNPNVFPNIVRGGIDLFAIAPLIPAGATQAVTLSLVANAPIPATDGEFVQVSRDVLTSIIDEAEHLAQFKEGGQEFQESLILHKRFISVAMETNKRLAMSGIFPTDLRRTISKEDEAQPRFALEPQ